MTAVEIESVDFFYAAMPEVTEEADGSQDALLVRVRAGGHEGWGECEASPLASIAAFVAPRSHGVCQPVSASVLGERLDGPADIARIASLVARRSMDLLQASHTWSGIEIALWDLLGRMREQPVWRMLGYAASCPKLPYASMLFGDDPHETYTRARAVRDAGFRALKVGWAGYGEDGVSRDADQVVAARDGLGTEGRLLVDAGQLWVDDVDAAAARMPALAEARATWLEEPFEPHAFAAHRALAARGGAVRLAGGEGSHTVHMATNLIDYGDVGFVQIDTGRIGGIGAAKVVADHAVRAGVTFVNHTFTTHLALSASLQPYAGLTDHDICEFPVEPKPVALALTRTHLERDADGFVRAPDAPGLGIEVDLAGISPYLRTVEITVDGQTLFHSPRVEASSRSDA